MFTKKNNTTGTSRCTRVCTERRRKKVPTLVHHSAYSKYIVGVVVCAFIVVTSVFVSVKFIQHAFQVLCEVSCRIFSRLLRGDILVCVLWLTVTHLLYLAVWVISIWVVCVVHTLQLLLSCCERSWQSPNILHSVCVSCALGRKGGGGGGGGGGGTYTQKAANDCSLFNIQLTGC